MALATVSQPGGGSCAAQDGREFVESEVGVRAVLAPDPAGDSAEQVVVGALARICRVIPLVQARVVREKS